jgi:hypothetical protein
MKIINYIMLSLLICLAGCAKMEVEVPTFDVTTDKTTYTVGEEVKFYLAGDANYVTFFSGMGLQRSIIEGTTYTQGYRYEYVNRTHAEGIPTLIFTNNRNNATGTRAGSLKVLISSDFNGTLDMASVQSATWTDISDRATWNANANQATSNINLSDFRKSPIYFAFKFEGEAATAQYGWTLRNFRLTNQLDDEDGPYYIFGLTASTGWSEVKFGATSSVENYRWTVNNATPAIATAATPNNLPAFESWLISSKFDLTTVPSDIGMKVKSFSEIVPPFHSYQYWVPGVYKVTFVASNSSVFGDERIVKNLTVTIVEP